MLTIRDFTAQDLVAIHATNEANLPHVNSLNLEQFTELANKTAYFKVAIVDGELAGFLMAMRPGADYASDNYQWFSGEYDDFIYVDRIITLDNVRGHGVGSALYQDIESYCHSCHISRICCEVNLRPANDASIQFHEKRNYKQVNTQETEGGKKSVSLRVKTL
ncbi:MAG: putative GNAT superfamily acetyltransferase [Chitinophagales bacterium]|jgi:predicted GNAT superfamily acetyltransferase